MRSMDKLCIFCQIISRKLPGIVVDESDDLIVLMSLENHPLIITKDHIPDIFTLSESLGGKIAAETIKIACAVKQGLACDGVSIFQSNGKAAGQDVFHFHTHVVPKWEKKRAQDSREKTAELIKQAM